MSKIDLTGNTDVDREMLLSLSNKDFLRACNTNRHLYYKVCNDNLIKRKIQLSYPGLLGHKPENKTWKQYFLESIWMISNMEKYLGYKYKSGNPELQYLLLQYSDKEKLPFIISSFNKNQVNEYLNTLAAYNAIEQNDIDAVKYFLENGIKIDNVRKSIENDNFEMFKLLVDNGVNIDDNLTFLAAKDKREFLEYLYPRFSNSFIKQKAAEVLSE